MMKTLKEENNKKNKKEQMQYDDRDTLILWSIMTTIYALEYSFYNLASSLLALFNEAAFST